MITNEEFRTWLHSLVPMGYYRGPSINVEDDEVHSIVTGLSGIGFDLEGALDVPGVQLRTIGKAGNTDDAELAAFELDKKVTEGPFPMYIAGKRVILINRIGGAPAPLPLDETNRSNYVCSYLVHQAAD